MATTILHKLVNVRDFLNASAFFALLDDIHFFFLRLLFKSAIVFTVTPSELLKHCREPDLAVDLCHALEVSLSCAFGTKDDVLMKGVILARTARQRV